MANKPPIPAKSDRVRNFPAAGPRKNPPPKPIPYQLHRGYKETGLLKSTGPLNPPPEPVKKPEPAPRKVVSPGQKNTVIHSTVPPRPVKGYVKINNGSDEDPLPASQGGRVDVRPRLDTPLSPPDPSIMANGVRSPPIAPLRVRAAASPKVQSEDRQRNAPGPQPLPRQMDKARVKEDKEEEEEKELYSEAYGHTQEEEEDGEDGEVYSTVVDAPRRVVSPGSSQSSASVTPPIPLPRSPPTAPTPSEGYNVTTHVSIQVRGNLPPKPTPVDSYSVLNRPDKPSRVFPPPDPDTAQMYSSLEVEGSPPPPPIPPRGVGKDGPEEGYGHLEFSGEPETDQDIVREHYELPQSPPTAPTPSEEYSVTTHVSIQVRGNLPPKPTPVDSYSVLDRPDKPSRALPPPDPDTAQMYSSLEVKGSPPPPSIPPRGVRKNGPEEGYGHLEFSGEPETDQDIVREHYEMSESYGGNGNQGEAEPSDFSMYETVGPQDNESSHAREARLTRSAPPGVGAKVNGKSPRVVARRASQKNKEQEILQTSRDRSSLEAYQDNPSADEGAGHVIGVVKLAPAPPPKRWKKPKLGEVEGQEAESGLHAEEAEVEMAVEDLYSIPPDAEDPDSQDEEGVGGMVLEPADDRTLEEAGYQTWRTFSPAENSTSLEGSSEQQQQLEASVEDGAQGVVNGRESRSSLMSECLAELQNLHSSSPHMLVSIDQLRMEKEKKDREELGQGGEDDRERDSERETSSETGGEKSAGQQGGERLKGGRRERATGAEGGEQDLQHQEEDISQYDLQRVQHPPLVEDAQGYCEVELQLSPTGPAGGDQAMMHVVALEGATPVDDLTNYDLQTVLHPPIQTSAQGYSYCDIEVASSGEWKPTPTKREVPATTSNNETTPPQAMATPPSSSFPMPSMGYTEIDVQSPTQGFPLPPSPADRRPPTPKPRKGRLHSRDDSMSSEAILDALHEVSPQEEQGKNSETSGDQAKGVPRGQDGDAFEQDLSEGDAVYAKVTDIKSRKQTAKKTTASPKPSPKMNRRRTGSTSEKASPKVTKKPRGPPRREAPPPPPGVTPAVPPAGTAQGPPPPSSSTTGEDRGLSKAEMIRELEQSLPPMPSQPRSPSRKGIHAVASDLTSSYPGPGDKGKSSNSPKLPNRGAPSPSPSLPQPESCSPQQKRSIFSRVKSSSVRNHRAEHSGNTSPMSPLADEVGFEKSLERRAERKPDSSPKLRWPKLRFRRTGSNGASNGVESSDSGEKNERKRRNREDKLPDVPDTSKTMSLPATARQRGLRGVHKHEGVDLEEEEDEFGIYSVVGSGSSSQAKKTKPGSSASAEAPDEHNAYEVIGHKPVTVRARTGSRGRNDRFRRSNSVEHLHKDSKEQEERELEEPLPVSHSATNSPILPRRAQGEGSPKLDAHSFHLGTLPRKKVGKPDPQLRHVYAMVSKSSGEAQKQGSKDSPPIPLPKPRKGGGRPKSPSFSHFSSVSTAASNGRPKEGTEAERSLMVSPSHGGATGGDRKEEDTLSLQGVPSSEISHTSADDGQLYAVVITKKKKKKPKGSVEGTVDESEKKEEDGDAVVVVVGEEEGEEGGGGGGGGGGGEGRRGERGAEEVAGKAQGVQGEDIPVAKKKKAPPKPSRFKPPKPAPYIHREGSPLPPPSPVSPSPASPSSTMERVSPAGGKESPRASVEITLGNDRPTPHSAMLNPPMSHPPTVHPSQTPVTRPHLPTSPSHSTDENLRETLLDVQKEVARLSMVGPPSFPPPPPPPHTDSPTPDDQPTENMYDVPPALDEEKPSPRAKHSKKKPVVPAVDEDDDWTPGYDVIAKPKKKPRDNPAPPKGPKPVLKQKSVPAENEKPVRLAQGPRVRPAHSTVIERPPHLYEAVQETMGDRAENDARPKTVAVPMRHMHIYEAPDQHMKPRPKSRLPPKNKPPPTPPGKTTPVKTGTNGQGIHDTDRGDISTLGQRPPSKLASPMTDAAHLGTNVPGKRLTVGIQYPSGGGDGGVGVGGGGGGKLATGEEPVFLFSKERSSHFIQVGYDTPDVGSTLSPCHSSTTHSSSTLSVYEDDSDADIMYSTDWETSSGEEDEEEEEEEEEQSERGAKPPKPKTFYIAQEILTTERTYVKGLELLDKHFRLAVHSANRAHDKPVLSEETLKLILGNVNTLHKLHSDMLDELEKRMRNWDSDPRIGDILLNKAPYLKMYTEHISKFDKALKTLEDCTKKNSHFARVLREFEAQPMCAHLPLAGFMLETVQRIPRYKLLLTDYVKHLPDESPDREPSDKALGLISSVATHVNDTIRQMDNFRKVVEVRKKLIGDTGDTLITPYRKLIKEGMLVKLSRKERQPRMFFLFNDILIYASSIPPTNTTFKVIKRIPLDGMRMEILNDPDMRYGFQIISTCKSFRLEASSSEELQQWMSAFEMAIREHREKVLSRTIARKQLNSDGGEDDNVPLGHLAPPWLPDSAVSMCQLCSVQFTVTRRRHHCRTCGMIFCSECSNYLAPLKYKNNKLGRVCQTCYESIVAEEGEEKTPKRVESRPGRSQKINLPSVLREVKARDQNAQMSGYLLSHGKTRRWRKKWFLVYNLVLYEFEKHEDVTAKRSIALPSYQVETTPDPLVFYLKHPGTGKLFFKADTEECRDRWLQVFQKAVKGEIDTQLPYRCSSPRSPDDDTSS